MNQLAPLPSPTLALPALVAAADYATQLRFLEFFAVTIRNPHTRRAYARAALPPLPACNRSTSRPGSRRWGVSWPRPASSSSSPA